MKNPEPKSESKIRKEDGSSATDFGIDIDLLQSNLALSLEERLQHHHAAYKLLLELENARDEIQS